MKTEIVLMGILRLLMVLVPGTWLAYYPFRQRLRLSERLRNWVLLGLVLITLLGWWQTQGVFPLVQLWQVICGCLFLSFYMLSVNLAPNRSAFIFFTVLCYECLVMGFAVCIADFLFSPGLMHEITYTVMLLLLSGCSFPVVYRQFKHRVTVNINHAPPGSLRHLYMLPLIYCLSHIYYDWIYQNGDSFGIATYFSILLVRASSIAFFVALVFHALDVAVEHDSLQQRMVSVEQVLAAQANQFGKLKDYIEIVRQTRHDMRHHIRVVRQFIETDDKIGLSAYIEDYSEGLPPAVILSFCENKPANFLLFYYYEQAQAKNIPFTIRASATPKLCITDSALSILLGNCFENAFEACERMTEGERFVRVNLQATETDFMMTVDNSFTGQFEKRGEAFFSSKRANRIGVGTSSMVALVEKYNGLITFGTKDNLFMVSIRIASILGAKPTPAEKK